MSKKDRIEEAMIELGWVKYNGNIWENLELKLYLPFLGAVLYELRETFDERQSNELFRNCLERATVLWKKDNPDENYWPDGAVNLVWLRNKIGLLERSNLKEDSCPNQIE